MCGLPLVAVSRTSSLAPVHKLLILVDSVLADPGSRGQADSCGCQAQLPRSMWDLPGAGIETASLALQGRLLTTGAARKPLLMDDSTSVLCVLTIAYGEPCRIRDLQRRFSFGTGVQA